MIKVELVAVGETKLSFCKATEAEFTKRLQKYCKLKTTIVPVPKGLSGEPLKRKEAELIKSKIGSRSYFALDEVGKEYTSIQFSKWLENQFMSYSELVFVVGGAEGLHETIQNGSTQLIALSKMTFSHQMIRGIWMEQLYRAFTIIQGHPYHNS